jgi:hypothetical protein
MRTQFVVALALPVVLLAGCKSKPVVEAAPPPPALSQVLPVLPFPPGAQPVSTASGADATQITVNTPEPPDSVANFYRKVLAEPPFRLVNESTTGGAISFLADQDGPSLWVTIRSDGKTGSQVTLAGAVVASAKKAVADTTGKKPAPN